MDSSYTAIDELRRTKQFVGQRLAELSERYRKEIDSLVGSATQSVHKAFDKTSILLKNQDHAEAEKGREDLTEPFILS